MTIKIVIVSDIFGYTDELEQLTSRFTDNAIIVDPYQACRHSFVNDKQAYQRFCEDGGMDAYIKVVSNTLKTLTQPYIIVGFSAGAAAAWHYLNDCDEHCQRAVLFYGGQVRHYANLTPKVPTTIVHPFMEEHFDIAKLSLQLSNTSNVKVINTPYQHGFMNPLSAGYDEKGANIYIDWLLSYMQKKTYVNT